jgi:hypothetical protein
MPEATDFLVYIALPTFVLIALMCAASEWKRRRTARRHAGYAARARAVNDLIENFHEKSRG